MISTFSVSITMVGSIFSVAKNWSITFRVADPTSNSTNGCPSRSRGITFRRRAKGCVGVVTSNSSSRSTGTVTRSDSSTGSVSSPASTRPPRISCTDRPAMATVRRTSRCGCTRRRCFSSGGKTYRHTVMPPESRSVPRRSRVRSVMAPTVSRTSRNTRWPSWTRLSAAGVIRT